MSASLSSSNEFISLVKELQDSPNNRALQQKFVGRIPAMKDLAKDDPLLMFHLANMYRPNSPEYKNTMRLSANKGCTNAMLALCQVLVKSGTVPEMQSAAHYMKMIQKSGDSHIKNLGDALLIEHPDLASFMTDVPKSQVHGFFNHKPTQFHSNTDYETIPTP